MPSSELTQLQQACEVLNLRMQEFEQVLLSLSDRVDRLQRQLEHLEEQRAPVDSEQQPPRPQQPLQKRRLSRPQLWLLVPLVAGAILVVWRGLPLLRKPDLAKELRKPDVVEELREPDLVKEQPAAITAPASNLLLRAKGKSWLEVQANCGASLHYGLMGPGVLTFPVDPAIRIRAGRPDLIEIQFKGQTRSLGAVNDLGWHRFALN